MEAFLEGCDWKNHDKDVGNVKMLMMLGQTFYMVAGGTEGAGEEQAEGGDAVGRECKVKDGEAWAEAVCVGYDEQQKVRACTGRAQREEGLGGAAAARAKRARERSERRGGAKRKGLRRAAAPPPTSCSERARERSERRGGAKIKGLRRAAAAPRRVTASEREIEAGAEKEEQQLRICTGRAQREGSSPKGCFCSPTSYWGRERERKLG
jgi:hypothetical protein